MKKYLFTLASGILTGLAMPGNLFSYLIWFSLAFYLYNMKNSQKTSERFLHTIIFSFSMLFTTLWWQIPVLAKNIPEIAGDYPAILGFLGFLGMIILLCLPYLLIWVLAELYHRKSRKENYFSQIFFYSLAFTSAEALREFGDFAFTGGSLSYAIYDFTGIIQIASITGYLGVTFLIVLINAVIAFDKRKNYFLKTSILLTLIFTINTTIERLLPINDVYENTFKITAVQMNVPQGIKYSSNIWSQYLNFTELIEIAEKFETDLIVFPESTFMEDINKTDVKNTFINRVFSTNKNIIMSYPRFSETDYYNTVWYYNNENETFEYYDKIKLTPFAEFLPYEVIFGNFDLFNLLRFYTKGSNYNNFNVNGVNIGAQICFETYFPEVSQNQTLEGAQFLMAVTNDGWFDNKIGLKQHFYQGVFRAVENRRDFVQVSNTGLTGRIDKYGRIIQVFEPQQEIVNTIDIELNNSISFYTRFKNLLIILLFIAVLIVAII